jgi:hypothetical protein
MSNSTVTPLTSEQENLMYDEMDKIEKRLAKVFKDQNTNAEELPDLIEMANDMKNP